MLGEVSAVAEHADVPPCRDSSSLLARLSQLVYHALENHIPSLAEISQAAGLSEAYTSRTFKALFGISFKDYTTLASINAARRLLQQSNLSIQGVATACHFQSVRTFSRQFREIAVCAPREYRARNAAAQAGDFDAPLLRPALESSMRALAETCPQAPSYSME